MAIKIDDRVFQRKLRKFQQKISKSSGLYDQMLNGLGIQATRNIEQHFIDARGSKGTAWAPLKPSTLEARARRTAGRPGNKFGPVPLRDTGEMSKINHQRRGAGVKVGTQTDYGSFHNFGFKNVPKREWAYIDKKGSKKLKSALSWFIARASDFKKVK